MSCLLDIKKFILPIAAALLFAAVTGIIIISKDKTCEAAEPCFSRSEGILVIDAGHGGADGGAVAANGIKESGINLSVALKLEALAKLFGVDTLMTRAGEELDYPDSAYSIREKKKWDQSRRLDIINNSGALALISIHQNTYPDPRPSGAQVLYGPTSGSGELAKLLQNELNDKLCVGSRRLAAPSSDSIFLMKNSEIPAVLLECGFISNIQELDLLIDEGYQRCLAAIVLSCYLRYSC